MIRILVIWVGIWLRSTCRCSAWILRVSGCYFELCGTFLQWARSLLPLGAWSFLRSELFLAWDEGHNLNNVVTIYSKCSSVYWPLWLQMILLYLNGIIFPLDDWSKFNFRKVGRGGKQKVEGWRRMGRGGKPTLKDSCFTSRGLPILGRPREGENRLFEITKVKIPKGVKGSQREWKSPWKFFYCVPSRLPSEGDEGESP